MQYFRDFLTGISGKNMHADNQAFVVLQTEKLIAQVKDLRIVIQGAVVGEGFRKRFAKRSAL